MVLSFARVHFFSFLLRHFNSLQETGCKIFCFMFYRQKFFLPLILEINCSLFLVCTTNSEKQFSKRTRSIFVFNLEGGEFWQNANYVHRQLQEIFDDRTEYSNFYFWVDIDPFSEIFSEYALKVQANSNFNFAKFQMTNSHFNFAKFQITWNWGSKLFQCSNM